MKRFFFSDERKSQEVKKQSIQKGLLGKYSAEIVYSPEEAEVVVVASQEMYDKLKREENESRAFILIVDEGQKAEVIAKTSVISCFSCAARAVITFVVAI